MEQTQDREEFCAIREELYDQREQDLLKDESHAYFWFYKGLQVGLSRTKKEE